MGNVNPPNKDVHRTYDLKGSVVGRSIEEASMIGPILVLKDMNWKKNGERLVFGPEKAKMLIEQLEKDVGFLKGEHIMDYSLLVGVHDMVKGNRENIRDATLAEFAVCFII
jgi:1-phosphatidylinositol-4-phosphate 5-kinase